MAIVRSSRQSVADISLQGETLNFSSSGGVGVTQSPRNPLLSHKITFQSQPTTEAFHIWPKGARATSQAQGVAAYLRQLVARSWRGKVNAYVKVFARIHKQFV